jgi:DNA-binding CsgD family transcriptional regulator
MDARITQYLTERFPKMSVDGIERLTPTERRAVLMFGMGMSTTRIAQILKRSHKTVETHRERAKNKLKLNGAQQIVVVGALLAFDDWLGGLTADGVAESEGTES